MAGVVPKKLSELKQNTSNAVVVALIIAKTDPKYFFVKKTMEFRGIITFTLRDAKNSICNCKYWGSKETVAKCNSIMKIGDVINVICPIVVINKFCSDENQRYFPLSTLPIMLVVNEGAGSLTLNDYRDIDTLTQLQELMFIPHKPICDALRLCDVRYSYMAIAGSNEATLDSKNSKMPSQQVDLLVMVALLRPVKDIQRKEEIVQCLEVIVFDQSIPDGMLLSIWHGEWIQRAQMYWRPMKTILHLIDVDIVDSKFHKCCILRKTRRTLIYENPLGKEVTSLREFVAEMEPRNFKMIGQMLCGDAVPNPNDIKTQMTVKQIYMRLEGNIKDDSEEFTAVLYAMMTQFNIDGFNNIIGRKCKSCQRMLAARDTVCNSHNCQLAFSLNHTGDIFDYFYNINISFGDHTGTLTEARLTESLAESIFETSAANFEQKFKLRERDLNIIKWLYLFKRFELKLVMKKTTAKRQRSVILIVGMQSADNLNQLSSNIMVY